MVQYIVSTSIINQQRWEMEDRGQQSISDDQELAKVLAGVQAGGADQVAPTQPVAPLAPPTPVTDTSVDEVESTEVVEQPAAPAVDTSAPSFGDSLGTSGSSELDSIKQQALGELRPLVDKLDVSAEEKFDTYLLLLRSTDDKDLIAPAHDAAKNIADEARRAQALLDIIKEIDFLSQSQK